MPTPAAGKLQGQRSQFSYLAPGGSGSQVQLKSITGWEMTVKVDEMDASDHDSAGWKDKLSGLSEWSATVSGIYFEGDASQVGILNALIAGAVGNGNVACSFFPQKGVAGDATMVYTGTAIITDWKQGAKQGSAQTIDVTLSGRGALVIGAQ
jgi:predicted secreted protein